VKAQAPTSAGNPCFHTAILGLPLVAANHGRLRSAVAPSLASISAVSSLSSTHTSYYGLPHQPTRVSHPASACRPSRAGARLRAKGRSGEAWLAWGLESQSHDKRQKRRHLETEHPNPPKVSITRLPVICPDKPRKPRKPWLTALRSDPCLPSFLPPWAVARANCRPVANLPSVHSNSSVPRQPGG
jgi:hypothetical protein